MAGKMFVRRRDGRIEVRLSAEGRQFVAEVFREVVAAERDSEHRWRSGLLPPITPSRDEDDPVRSLQRQQEIATNCELALITVEEQFLNEGEAWVWLSTLQTALRVSAAHLGLFDDESLERAPQDDLDFVRTLQLLLFALAECL